MCRNKFRRKYIIKVIFHLKVYGNGDLYLPLDSNNARKRNIDMNKTQQK